MKSKRTYENSDGAFNDVQPLPGIDTSLTRQATENTSSDKVSESATEHRG